MSTSFTFFPQKLKIPLSVLAMSFQLQIFELVQGHLIYFSRLEQKRDTLLVRLK